ncbi:MAG: 16S rRNA (guanine(527)-N(7))-methyltransferase RsmG [Desulfobulbaceae bacterium]|mgnify:CR=1 FL=1|nr:MAG: 16S rRNA (guanine(527)-N(7))-methyltransferase RsmG [Desulfobulbaceae bacterium]
MPSCDDFLARGCRAFGLDLSAAQRADLCCYYRELDKWSKKMNLVAKAPMEEILASHFLDSLSLLPHLPQHEFRLLDVGSGAGFPGLVLKTVCPAMQLTLVEPRAKRVTFLRHIIRTLQLARVTLVQERLAPDEAMVQRLGLFDVVTSRALADIKTFLSLAEPFVKAGGRIICMKGPKAAEELAAWQAAKKQPMLTYRGGVVCPTADSGKQRQLLFFENKERLVP